MSIDIIDSTYTCLFTAIVKQKNPKGTGGWGEAKNAAKNKCLVYFHQPNSWPMSDQDHILNYFQVTSLMVELFG